MYASRLLTKVASGVLASLRGSTYGTEYDFASSLVAALLDGLSEQPAGHPDPVTHRAGRSFPGGSAGFVNTLLDLITIIRVSMMRLERRPIYLAVGIFSFVMVVIAFVVIGLFG